MLVACPLLFHERMHHNPNTWRRLNPETIAQLPEEAAVFEVANLVRTVQFIGTADGNLRARVAAIATQMSKLPVSAGGYYVRWEPTAAETEALEKWVGAFRTFHRGAMPQGNLETPTHLRVASRRAA